MKPEEMTIGEKKQLKLMKKVEASVAKVMKAFSKGGHIEVYSAMRDLEVLLEKNKLDPHCSDERERAFNLARITGNLEPVKLSAMLKQNDERPLSKDDVPYLARTLKKSIKEVMLEYGFTKPVKKTKPKTPAKAVKVKVPIEEADLDNMTDAQIRRTYAKDIKEHAEWIWREQGRGGTLSMRDCLEGTMREIRNGMWPDRDDD